MKSVPDIRRADTQTPCEYQTLYQWPFTSNIRLTRFEKSLYDLIKGLRNNKGAEDEYIQNCLRECKAEVKSQDMGKACPTIAEIKTGKY